MRSIKPPLPVNGWKNQAAALAWALVFVLTGLSPAMAQAVDALRPGLDTSATSTNDPTSADAQPNNQTSQPAIPATTAPTNAPRAITLQSTQPLPPPPPPRVTLPPREQDPYAPLGLRAGSVTLSPVLETTGVFTDNVRATGNNKRKDYGLRLAPSLTIQSNWSRHSLIFTGSSEHIIYPRTKEFNAHTVNLSTTGRIDVRRTTTITTTGAYQLSETSNASSEVPGTAIGNRRDHTFSVSSALAHRTGRLLTTLSAGASWYRFDNVKLAGGGIENNADREYVAPVASLRFGYEISPAISPYVEVGYAPRFHRLSRDRNNLARNSQGVTAKTGLAFNFSPIWDGDVALTYEHRRFSDTSLATIDAFGVNATINWRPTRLTTITLVSNTSIDESATIGNAGTVNHDLALDITHKFRENITGTLDFGFNYDDFANTNADDMYFILQAGIGYNFNRKVEWLTNYQLTRFKSGTPGNDYTENRFTTGFRFRL